MTDDDAATRTKSRNGRLERTVAPSQPLWLQGMAAAHPALLSGAAQHRTPPPAGATPLVMHAAALMLFTVGLWATGVVPEYVTSLLFFLLAVLLAVASPQVVFSSFASATMWLVLGGLLIAEAVSATGLGRRFAGVLFERFVSSYSALIIAIAVVATVLSFFMPATVARMLLLLPIVVALAERVGFAYGSSGYNGLCMTAIMITYQSGSAILPANAPNLVLAGATETLYATPLIYAESTPTPPSTPAYGWAGARW